MDEEVTPPVPRDGAGPAATPAPPPAPRTEGQAAGARGRPGRPAAPGVSLLQGMGPGADLAQLSHWRVLILADVLLGISVVGAGIALAVTWNVWVGALVAVAGLAYLWVVRARYHHWRQLRREAGLPT